MSVRGRLITIEGIDGSGKTTLVAGLDAALAAHGVRPRLLREPGGVEVSERIRSLVKDPSVAVAPRAEALLYAAARAQLVEELLAPLLDDGAWVLLDRFVDSSLAYQGAGRGLGVAAIAAINAFATAGLTADRTLLLQLDPLVARGRTTGRGETPDRLELELDGSFSAIAAAYDRLAAADPERVRVLDATRPPQQLVDDALAAVADLLP